MKKYIAAMGYTNNLDLALKAINSVKPLWNNLIIIDNSICKDIYNSELSDNITVIPSYTNLSCSQMFNFMQELARKRNADILISMHSDIEVKEGACNRLIEYLNELNDRKWGVVLTMHDSLAAWNMDAVDIIGPWDERIDQYPTDADYLRRLELFNYERLVTLYEGQVQHFPSATINKNLHYQYLNSKFVVNKNREYYKIKWGDERFRFPFNGEDINFIYNKLVSNEIYSKLYYTFETTEGAFLQETNRETRIAQFTFVTNIIKAVKPRVILETGTHKSFFAYFLSNILDSFKLYTFDMNPNCQKGVDILNSYLPNVDIIFTLGDTIKTLRTFNKIIDFAYIDGGHDFEVAYNDLKNVMEMGIKNILVDDIKMPPVNKAIVTVMKENLDYYVIENPMNDIDCRGMILIRRKRNI